MSSLCLSSSKQLGPSNGDWETLPASSDAACSPNVARSDTTPTRNDPARHRVAIRRRRIWAHLSRRLLSNAGLREGER
jgi:hypothetical protein